MSLTSSPGVRILVEDEQTGDRVATYTGIPRDIASRVMGWLGLISSGAQTLGALRTEIERATRPRSRGRR